MKKEFGFFVFCLVVMVLLIGGASAAINFTKNVVSSNAVISSVHLMDVDNDGDIDILGGREISGTGFYWWKNNGSEVFTGMVVDPDFDQLSTAYAADVDNDGDIDIIGAQNGYGAISWWENDGSEVFTEHIIKDWGEDGAGVRSIYLGDFNKDGYIDFVDNVNWIPDEINLWENNKDGTFTRYLIGTPTGSPMSVFVTDLDNDGDEDILTGEFSGGRVLFYENDGEGNFGPENVIIDEPIGLVSIFAIDLDNDGDIDVLTGGQATEELSWWENNLGVFSEHVIDSTFGFYQHPRCISAADMDNDGDIDVVVAGDVQKEIAWWENNGGEVFTKYIIDVTLSADEYGNSGDIYVIDIDGDSDKDIIGGWIVDEEIVLWKNNLYTELPSSRDWLDMNGDIISSANVGDTVQMVATGLGSGTFEVFEEDDGFIGFLFGGDDEIKSVDGVADGDDVVGLWTITQEDLEPTSDYGEFKFEIGGDVSEDLAIDTDEDDDPMNVTILSPVCGSDFDEGEVVPIEVGAFDSDDLITGSVTIDGTVTPFSNGGVSFYYTFDTPGDYQVVAEGVNDKGEKSRSISNIMVLDRAGDMYIDGVYSASCIDKPEDFSNIQGNVVEFDASSTRAIKVISGAINEILPGSTDLNFYWSFLPDGRTYGMQYVGTGNSLAYKFITTFASSGDNSATLSIKVT